MRLSRFLRLFQTEDYLDEIHLSSIRDYRYSSVDLSPISRFILRFWWNLVAFLMPSCLAPNVITLTGFSFILFNVGSIIVLMPDLEGPAPRWMYFSFAICLFIYQTLDNVDAKQARKTNTSSPLGEIFEHGIDALTCVFASLAQCVTLGLGHSPYAILLILLACWPMYLSTWELYHTGTLFLGPINGPTEGILIACAVHLLSGIKGPDYWSEPAKRILPSWMMWPGSENAKMADAFMVFAGLALVVGVVPTCLFNVKRSKRSRLTKREHTIKGDYLEAITQLTPMFAFTGLSLTWILSPYSSILDREKLIEFAFLLCFIFGRMSAKLMLAHLTRGVFPWFTGIFLPLLLGNVLVNAPLFGLPTILSPSLECVYLRIAVFFSFLTYGHTSLHIIDKFCAFLGINCFTIPPAHGKRQWIKE